MLFGGLQILPRARLACAVLSLWGASALAGPAPERAAAPAPVERREASPAASPAVLDEPKAPGPDMKGLGLDGSEPPEANEGMGWALLRMVVVLGIVVGLVYVTLNYGLRRMMGLQAGSSARQPLVSVVERVPLDPKRSLFVLKAAGEYLLVGGGESALSLICKLDPAEVARIEEQRPAPASPRISPFLQKLLSRRGGSPPPSA